MDFALFCRAAAGLVECRGWCGWGGRGGTSGAGTGDLLVCERSGDGLSWSPPARPLQKDTMRKLMVGGGCACVEYVPADRCRLTGGQRRPTDRAMAARSARTSSSEEHAEEDVRSTDEEDRLLTNRCIERQWKTLCLRVKRLPCDHKSDGQS